MVPMTSPELGHPDSTGNTGSTDNTDNTGSADTERALVVTSADDTGETNAQATPEESRPVTDLVEQPAKVMRIGSMIKQLLDEVRSAPLDKASRARLKEIYERSIVELEDGLAPELVLELDRLTLPFSEASIPSEAELRIVQAQLVGWLEGLFHGIQTALFAQQMAAQAQLEEMRRKAVGPGGEDQSSSSPTNPMSGPYL